MDYRLAEETPHCVPAAAACGDIDPVAAIGIANSVTRNPTLVRAWPDD